VESKKLVFLFYVFSVIDCDFFIDLAKIIKKKRDKTAFKPAYNQVREIKHTVLKIKEGGLPDVDVYEEKADFWQKLRKEK
jgi:hypothetical protein